MQFLPQLRDLAIVVFVLHFDLAVLFVLTDQGLEFLVGVVSVLLVLAFYYSVFLYVLEHCFLIALEGF